ncbi:MAG: hypothetical protein AB9873_12590 [Syntrophobacteraceae bacterium]
MQVVMSATYKDGVLVPDRSLGVDNEGKRFRIIVVEEDRSTARRERFFRFVKAHSFHLPEGYRFNRDELYER